MEDIDGGLHPAVDGQSLDEDEEYSRERTDMISLEYVITIVGCLDTSDLIVSNSLV